MVVTSNRRVIKSAWVWIAFSLMLVSFAAVSGPKIVSWKTPNGIKVMYVHAPSLPMVDIRIMFNAGSARDGKQKGLASLTNRVSILGAAGKTATQLAESFESVGAKQERGALRDSAWYSLRSLNDEKYLSKAITSLAKIITKPEFKKSDIERERKRVLIALKQQQQSPSGVAKKAFFKAVFADHPYAGLPHGTKAGVKSIRRKNMLQFHKKYYVGSNAVVAIVGAVDEERARKIVSRLTKDLPKGQPAAALPEVKPLTQSKTIRIKHPSSQTHILIGQPGVYRGHADYFALYLANHALGGNGLVSRLSEEVREKRGLSYSVYSYFIPMRRSGPYIMGMQTKNNKADEGIAVMNEVVRNFVDKGMTKKEIIASQKNIVGGFALRIESNSKIVEYLTMIAFYNLPETYLDDFPKKIAAITLEQANTAFRKQVKPEKMVTIIVGGQK